MARKVGVVVVLLVSIGLLFAEDTPPDKTAPGKAETTTPKRPWGNFKVGSNVTLKEKDEHGTTTIKKTLVNLDADKATVKSEISELEPFEEKIPLKGYFTDPKDLFVGKELSRKFEEIEIAKQKFQCEVVEIETGSAMWSEVRTTWYCKDSICGFLKEVSKKISRENKDYTMSTTRTASKLEETITIAKKKVKCIVFEVVSEDHDSTSKGKEWLTDQIPGFLAKSETNVKAGGKTVKETAEVSAFEVK